MEDAITTMVQILCLERQKLTTEYRILKIEKEIKDKSVTSSHNDNNDLIEKDRIDGVTSDLKQDLLELEAYLTELDIKLSNIDKHVINNIV